MSTARSSAFSARGIRQSRCEARPSRSAITLSSTVIGREHRGHCWSCCIVRASWPRVGGRRIARSALRLLEECQALHGEAVAQKIVYLAAPLFGGEQRRVEEEQGRLTGEIVPVLPGR